MNKLRTASAVVGAVAAVAIGGAAFAAGGDDPSPSPSVTDDKGGTVDMLPDGTVVTPSASADDNPSPSDLGSSAPTSAPTHAPSATPPATSRLSISLDRAKTIALRAAGGGYVRKAESETEHGRAVWDVDVIRNGVEHDIDVDKATGSVTRHRVKGNSTSTSTKSSGSDDSSTHDAGDDKGSDHKSGSDDKGGDDKGGDDKGGDDKGGDDKGGHGGHGSDD